MIFTCCSRPTLKLENGKDPSVSFSEPLKHVITLRGPSRGKQQEHGALGRKAVLCDGKETRFDS